VDDPQKIVAVREGAPLVVGSVDGEGVAASDIPALLPYTRSIHLMDDHELAVVARDGIHLFDAAGKAKEPKFQLIAWDPVQAEKGGYKHFMLKEIYEQPSAIGNTVLGRLSLDTNSIHFEDTGFTNEQWKSFKQIRFWHTGRAGIGFVGRSVIESLARVPVEAMLSEFRYRNPIILPESLLSLSLSPVKRPTRCPRNVWCAKPVQRF
jgi:glucosamine--fructose-6-phosphate aminotransferase (isomerizing)